MTEPKHYYFTNNRLAVALIFLYWITFEWVFFLEPMYYGGPALFYLTNAIKLCLPVVLICITGFPSFKLVNRRIALGLYTFFYFALIAWSCIPTIISGNPVEILKQIPRFLFFLAVVSFFMRHHGAIRSYAKTIGGVMLLVLAQYVSIYLLGAFHSGLGNIHPILVGHFNIFGNVLSGVYLGNEFGFLRLAGFWSEPAKASAVAFAAFFLLRYVFIIERRTFWRYSSYCCLAAGLFCLSNAGYLALGIALLFGVFCQKKRLSLMRSAGLVVLVALSGLLVFAALFGREYVMRNYSDNYPLRAFVGIREVNLTSFDDMDQAYSGRVGLYRMVISTIKDNPLGVGLQSLGSKGIESSASAPLLWLHLTGIVGFLLLMLREAVLFSAALHLTKLSTSSVYLVQAWIVVLVHDLSYGAWMTPNYLILAAALLSMSAREPSGNAVNKYTHH